MTATPLFSGLTAIQTLPSGNAVNDTGPKGSNLPNGSQMADLSSGGALTPSQPAVNQSFQLTVTGSGNVSGTVQPLASNDGVHWVNYGSTIVVNSGAAPQSNTGSGSTPFAFFSAQLTAIGGTNAKATCIMNA